MMLAFKRLERQKKFCHSTKNITAWQKNVHSTKIFVASQKKNCTNFFLSLDEKKTKAI